MRRILVDNARRKSRLKHGGHLERGDLEEVDVAAWSDDLTILKVDQALEELEANDPVCGKLVKVRFFAEIPNQPAASMVGLSERSAKRNWACARAWLAKRLKQLD